MKTNHNQYVSTPNWFSSVKEEVKQTKPAIQQNVYYGSGSNSNNNGISSLSIYNKAVYKEDTLQLSDLSIMGYAVIAIQKEEENNAGELTVNDAWSSSLFIPVVGGSEITINTSYDSTFTYGIAFYDVQKKYISGNHTVQELIQTVIVPTNAVYFRICALSVYEEFNVKYQGLSNYSYKQLTNIYGKGLDPFTSIDDSFEYLYSSTFTLDKISFVADYPLKLEIDSDNNIHFNINDLLLSGVFVTTSEEEQDIDGIKIFKNGLGIGDFLLIPDKTNNSIKLIHKNELIEKESNTYFGNMYVTGWFSALGMSPGGIGPSFGGSNNLFELNDVSTVYNEQGIPYAVLGTTGENTVGKVLTWDGSKWYADEVLNSIKGDERYLLKKIFSKIFTAYNEKGEIIDITDYDSIIDNVSINYSLWSTGFISAYGMSKGDPNPTALYQLTDVLSENNEVQGAAIGSVLTYNGTHWYASKLDIDSSIDTDDILDILDQYDYLTKDEADDAYLLKQVFKNIFTAYDADDNEVDICDISANINNIKINYGFWSNSFISALGKQLTEPSSTTALYQLVDVLANETNTGVKYAKKGSVLTFDGTHWIAGVVNTNGGIIDEAAIMKIIERYNYLDQTAGDKRYLLNDLFLKIFTAYDEQGNKVDLSSDVIDNIKVNYNFWSDGYLSSRGISDDIINAIDFIEVDEKTISKQNGYLEVIGGVGNGITDAYTKAEVDALLSKKWTQNDIQITNWNTAFEWGNHASAGYLKKEAIYDESIGCWKLKGDLIVTGGITMYGTDGTTVSTIWDNAPKATTTNSANGKGIASFDSNYFSVSNGHVTFIGSTGGGLDETELKNYLSTNNYLTKSVGNSSYLGINNTAKKATELTNFSVVKFTKTDNSGYPCYLLISDVTTWYNASSDQAKWGIVGYMYGSRGGNLSGTCSQKIVALCSYNNANYRLQTDIKTFVAPKIVKYNSKYYLALYMQGSGRDHYFIGEVNNLLDSPINLNCTSSGTYSGLTVVFDTEQMSLNGVNAATATKATYDDDGNNIVNTYLTKTSASTTYLGINAKAVSASTADSATTATNANKVLITGSSSDGSYRVVFSDMSAGTNGNNSLYVDSVNEGLRYNPSTNQTTSFSYMAGATGGYYIHNTDYRVYADSGEFIINTPTYFSVRLSGARKLYMNNSGAFGIGTTSPKSELHVNGRTLTKILGFDRDGAGTQGGYIEFQNTYEMHIVNSSGSGNIYFKTNIGSSIADNVTILNYGGLLAHYGIKIPNAVKGVSIANTSGTYHNVMSIDSKNNFCLGYDSAESNYDSYLDGYNLYFRTNSSHTKALTIDSSGVLAINTSSNAYTNSTLVWKNLSSTSTTIYGRIGTNDSGDMGIYARGSVILRGGATGSSAPAYGIKLDTQGTANITSSNAHTIVLNRATSSGGSYIKSYANNQTRYSWAFGTNNTHQFSIWYQDTTNSIDLQKMCLDSSGNMLVTGGVTMYSDERKKTILNHVELTLKEVADAPIIEHYYNSDEKKTTHVGSIAQYWAGLNNWFCKKDDDGYYTMEIQNAALASAISVARELIRYESKTDKQIRLLKERICELEDEIEILKSK